MQFTISNKQQTYFANPVPGAPNQMSDVRFAASFKTADEARQWARVNRNRLGLGADPQIVSIDEQLGPVKRVEVMGVPLSTDLFALKAVRRNQSALLTSPSTMYAKAFTPGDVSVFAYDFHEALLTPTQDALLQHINVAKPYRFVLWTFSIVAVRETREKLFVQTVVGPALRHFHSEFKNLASTVIDAIRYDHVTRVAQLDLKRAVRKFSTDGKDLEAATYEYSDVAAEDIFAFLAAPSKGTFFAKTWKGKYDKSAVKV